MLWANPWHTTLAECGRRAIVIFRYKLSTDKRTSHLFYFGHCRLTAGTVTLDSFIECSIFVGEFPMEFVTDTGNKDMMLLKKCMDQIFLSCVTLVIMYQVTFRKDTVFWVVAVCSSKYKFTNISEQATTSILHLKYAGNRCSKMGTQLARSVFCSHDHDKIKSHKFFHFSYIHRLK